MPFFLNCSIDAEHIVFEIEPQSHTDTIKQNKAKQKENKAFKQTNKKIRIVS